MRPDSFITLLILLFLFDSGPALFAQESFRDKVMFGGYISGMGQGIFLEDENKAVSYYDLRVHNRINLNYFANDNFTFRLGLRNQLIVGEMMNLMPDYGETIGADNGFMDLSFNWWERGNSLMNTQIDRLYIEFIKGKWEVGLGRQRVNWGRSLVWNPNDIFNAFSYYEVDYPERPGSDALRVSYYYGTASSAELVAKLDSSNTLTIAALTKFNKWGYDFQFMGGYVNETDFVIGAGWEGSIGKIAFRGEATWYHPKTNFADTTGAFLGSISFDYAINSKWTAQLEFLYNDPDNLIDMSMGTASLYSTPASSKTLSFSEYNFFGSINYLVSPILTFNLSGIYYTDYNGFFIMPDVEISVSKNLNASLMYQYFNFEIVSKRETSGMAFARLKWNF